MTFILLGCAPALHGSVVINEVVTAGSERLLRFLPDDTAKLGPGMSWYEPGSSDAGWQIGAGPFGFGSFPNVSPAPTIGTNTATQMQNLTPTLYLRKTFNVSAADASRTDGVVLDVQFNDGFICYLNGVEVIRRNAGPPKQFAYRDQFAAFGTPATNEPSNSPYLRTESLGLGAANTVLVAGENVIAFHVLNYWETTSAYNVSTNAFTTVDNRNNFYFKGDLRLGGGSPSTLVTNNSQWRYLPGVVEPSGGVFDPALLFAAKLNVPWGKPAFDDADWNVGAAPFGAGIPPSGVTLGTNLTSQVPSKATSVYFRTVFTATVNDLADPLPLQLLMDYDDSFVAYLNGVEVARDRLGQANAFTPHNAVADSARTPGSPVTYNLDPPARLLQQGENVLSVQVHNVSLNDADLFFRCLLRTNSSGTNRIMVQYTNPWKYFVGLTEPIVSVDESTEDNPEAPESDADWVELHNSGTETVNLGNWSLTDDPSRPAKWRFPAGTTIPAGGHLIVVCDGLNITAPAAGGLLHTNFKLSAAGETVGLYNQSGTLIQHLAVPAQTPFQSFGRTTAGDYRYFDVPTPAAPNQGVVFDGIVAAPVFGRSAGFYSSAQSVTLTTSTPGATIRYTVDGSEPTELNGINYSGPLTISSSTTRRARAFRNGYIPSKVVTATYLVNEPSNRRGVAALCVSGDQRRSLYRPFGVMAISGGGWTSFAAPLPTSNNSIWSQAGPSEPGAADLSAFNNPIHRGRFMERRAVMEILYPNGAPGFNTDFGIRIAGSAHARPRYQLANQNRAIGPNDGAWSTSPFTQKPSFNFYFRNDLGGDPAEFPIFPGSPVMQFHDLRCRAGKNELSTRFAVDECMRRLFIDMGQIGSRGIINTFYVNGVYKGYYNLTEHLREDFFQRHYQSTASWDVRQVTVIASGDGLAFQEMITFLRNNPQSSLSNYRGMQRRLDTTNFIDYLIVNVFGVTGDWPHNNFVCGRERSARGLHRYHVWDAEGAFGGFSGNVRTNQFVTGTTGSIVTGSPASAGLGEGIRILYTLLRASPEFRLQFADRLQRHFFNGGALTEAKVLARWNELNAEMQSLGVSQSSGPVTWTVGAGDPTRYTTAGATNSPSRRNVLFHGYIDDTAGGVFVQPHLVAEGLWPSVLAPTFSQFGGTVAPGFTLTIQNPNPAGAIYFTTDGRDPRAEGGAVQGTTGNSVPIGFPTTVKARVLSGTTWSPLTEAYFDPGTKPSLLITEIMYHPPNNGSVSGDEYEFIEIKNVGGQPVNLFGLSFTSGINYGFPAGATIGPGQHRVIARSAPHFGGRYPGVPLLDAWGSGSELSNSGETLTLSDASGRTVFGVTWSDTAPWPVAPDGSGPSLVPIAPNANPTPDNPNSWRASASHGGSPGSDDPEPPTLPIHINELIASPISPAVDRVELHNPNGVQVDISDWWLSDSIATPKKYRIANGTVIPAGGYLVLGETEFNVGANGFSFSANGEEAIIASGNAAGALTGFSHAVRFGASEQGVSFGRYLNSQDGEFFVAQRAQSFGFSNSGPRVGPVVLTELMVQPGPGGDEYVELRNISDQPVALFQPQHPANTWGVNGIAFNFPAGVTLEPRQVVLLSPIAPAAFATKYNIPPNVAIYGPYTGALNNAGERIALQKPGVPFSSGGQTVVPYIEMDAVSYSPNAPWPAVAANGKSLERVNAHGFGDDPQNWQASSIGGSVAVPTALTFSAWREQHFTATQLVDPNVGGANADPDHDGLSNFWEWALGRNPLAADAAGAISTSLSMDGSSGPHLTIAYRLSLSAVGLTDHVDTASAPDEWSLDSSILVGQSVNDGDGARTIIRRDAETTSTATKRFIRLRIDAN